MLFRLSARRCCLCFRLNKDLLEKKGQIAHLDQNKKNIKIENLAWLCIEHHDAFDSKTSQSKNYTLSEVKDCREELYKIIAKRKMIAEKAKSDLMVEIINSETSKKSQLNLNQKYLNNVPLYNLSELIGRNDYLNLIHSELTKNQPIFLINSIGGIGKTTIAKAYVNNLKYAGEYQNILWVTIINDTIYDFVTQLQVKRIGFKIFEELDIKENLLLLLDCLRQLIGNNLIVIDNANDPKGLSNLLNIIKSIRWKILITSRAKPENIYVKVLETLPLEQAKKVFYKYYTRENNDKKLELLLGHINYHTLLIELLAKAGNKNQDLSINKMYKLLKKEDLKANEFQRKINLGEHGSNIGSVFEDRLYHYILSIFNLEKLSETEEEYLRYFSILPQVELSEKQLIDLFEIKSIEILLFVETLEDLVKKGWLIEARGVYKMHPLINKVLKEKLKPDMQNCEPVVDFLLNKLILEAFKYIDFLPIAVNLLELDTEKKYIKFKLAHRISKIYRYLKDYNNAIKYAKISYSYLIKISHKNKEAHLAQIYKNFSSAYRGMNNFKEAKDYAEKSLNLRRKLLGDNSKETLESFINLSKVNTAIGVFDDALTFAQNALDIAHNTSEFQNYYLHLIYHEIGYIHQTKKDYKTSIEYFLLGITHGELFYKRVHPLLTSSYKNLAISYFYYGDMKNALKFIRTAVEQRKKIYPQNHPDLLKTIKWDNKISDKYRSILNKSL
ncbi:MAG: hypothetical protein A2275_09370 [Bacteroidetes bacterium RIFOXYA12_FULL_35_11]|nr:MAG: hypothetical protein A2X01_04410 [Bacteroidetes bacterium GWF2_35_48]OFY73719.1 MAG: hypothetical protein A2275_09370 [Bacteroidetes bacterium RIFOXYA12_FULL_35_11]OFY93073.1 MAG: hypothetical protein A2491_01725 [Bacteroidetes bacterium RIFOXYC12_FULL_35_7]